MPLSAVNFVPEGTNAHTDHLQFYQLLTGVMADQPVSIANTLSAVALVSTGGGISAPSGTAIVFSTGGAARWTILNTGQLQTSVDGAVNIGSTVSGRPNNIYITGALSVGSTNDRLRTPNSGTDFNLETASGTLTLAGLAASYSCANAYYDGAAWQRFNAADAAFLAGVNQNSFIVDHVAAGANPITWVGILTLDSVGNLTIPGQLAATSISLSGAAFINFPSGGQIVSSGAAGYVQINQLTVTPGACALASLQVNGNATVSGILTVTQYITGPTTIQTPDGNNYLTQSSGYLYMRFNAGLVVQTTTGVAAPIICGGVSATTITASSTIAAAAGIYANGNMIYFSNTGYYLQNAGNQLNVAGMNLLSWGWVGFNGNASLQIAHNGSQFVFAQNIIVPSYLYLVNTTVAIYYNGSGVQCTNIFYSTGLYDSGRLYTNGWDYGWSNNLGGNTYGNGTIAAAGEFAAYSEYNGSNLNCFLALNAADYRGQGLAYSWGTWACVDHALEYGLRLEPISDPLCYVRHITGWSYDHVSMDNHNQNPQRDEDGEICFAPSYGFKASEVAQYLPELVGFNPETGKPESIDLDRMGVVLWEAFKQYANQTDARLSALERSNV